MNVKFLFLAALIAVFSDNCYCTDYLSKYTETKHIDYLLSPMILSHGKYENPNEWAKALKESESSINWYLKNPYEEFFGISAVYQVLVCPSFAINFLNHKNYKDEKELHLILLNLLRLAPRALEHSDLMRFRPLLICYQNCIELMEKNGILSVLANPSFKPIFDSLASVIASHFDSE